MAKSPNDDLFADTTMTFGEHLEELRGALFRALVGIVVGFLIGLSIATYVVEWIKSPLSSALREYYLDTALLKLDEKYSDEPQPELVTLIEEDRLVPESVSVEPLEILAVLKNKYPDQFGQVPLQVSPFTADDIVRSKAAEFVQQLSRGGMMDDSPWKVVWKNLSPEHRENVKAMEGQSELGSQQQQKIVHILNDLTAQRSLHEGKTFEILREAVSDERTRATADALHRRLQEQFDADQSRRLNRLLLASAFDDYLRRPRPHLVELSLWKPVDVTVQTLSAHEGFMIWIKAALISGIIISCPWIFWQIWDFIAAGLYPHEKRFVHVFLPFSVALFLAGAALAFFFVFEPVLDFLFSFNRKMNIEAAPRISEWLSFVLFLPLGFGVSFQLPLVMLFLDRIGVFSVATYISSWRVAILVIFVLAMFLTPADPISMLLMAVPLTVLYFGGILLCVWMPQRSSPMGRGYEP